MPATGCVLSPAGECVMTLHEPPDTVLDLKRLIQAERDVLHFRQRILHDSTCLHNEFELAALLQPWCLTLVVLPYRSDLGDALLEAAKGTDVQAVSRILESPVGLSCCGTCPLFAALHKNWLPEEEGSHQRETAMEMLRLLVEARADARRAGRYGFTALHLAAGAGHTDAARLLLDAGANVNAQNQECWDARRQLRAVAGHSICHCPAVQKPPRR